MKWHQQRTDARDKAFEKSFFNVFGRAEGHECLSVWMGFKRELSGAMDLHVEDLRAGRSKEIRATATIVVRDFASDCNSTAENVRKFVAHWIKAGEVKVVKKARDWSWATLEWPKFLRDIDSYAAKAIRKISEERGLELKRVLNVSGQCPDTLRTLSSSEQQADSRASGEAKAEAAPPCGKPGEELPAGEPPEATPEREPGEDREEELPPPAAPAAAPPPPAPPPPPRAGAAAACPAADPAAEGAGPAHVDINRPHPISVQLLMRLGFKPRQAIPWAREVSVREVCAVEAAAQGGEVQRQGGYAHSLLKGRFKRDAELSVPQVLVLKQAIEDFERAYRNLGRGADRYDFATQVGFQGHLMGAPLNLGVRAFRR